MIRKISVRLAINTMLGLSALVIVFHLLVLGGVIPFDMVWGGRLKNATQMRLFEAVSITVNLLIVSVLLMKGGYIKSFLSEKTITGIFWALFALFSINTFGNVLSESTLETKIFTPLTLISAVLSYLLATENILNKKINPR